jgi:hypothetical protein
MPEVTCPACGTALYIGQPTFEVLLGVPPAAPEPKDCPGCIAKVKKRAKAAARRARQKEMDDAMESLGLTKVRGAVTGKIYWE